MLANGFYEWQGTGGTKRPMRIVMQSGEPFAFAGLWSVWRDPDGNRIPSCAIIHDGSERTAQADQWPDAGHPAPGIWRGCGWTPASTDPGALGNVLVPNTEDAMEACEVFV